MIRAAGQDAAVGSKEPIDIVGVADGKYLLLEVAP